jgi:hypothetical protein
MIKVILKLLRMLVLEQHQFKPSTLIHRKAARVVYEVEFNWYDENLKPVSVVREVQSGKIFSIRGNEATDFKEFSGTDPLVGSTL